MKAVTRAESKRPSLKDWLAAARFQFLPQGVNPVILGAVLAFFYASSFNWLSFILAFIAAGCVQVGLTMLNDTLDYSYGTDKLKLHEKNHYTGGSGVFSEGIISPRSSLKVIFILYLIAFVIAIYFAITVGWGVMIIAVIGGVISIAYSVRPFHLAYRGLGELAMLAGYGPIITMFSYYVQTGGVTWESFWVGILPGFCMFTMILINEMPDAEEDRAANKKNITYRLGVERTKNLYIACIFMIFVYVSILVLLGVLPVYCLLIWVGLPLGTTAAYYANKYWQDPLKVASSNKFMVFLYSWATLSTALGILIGALS